MKRPGPRLITITLIGVVIVPLLVSLVWRQILGACDYIALGGLFLLMIVLPFVTPLESGFGRQFGLQYAVWVVWSIWRGLYFDSITNNDIPGSGYFLAALLYCGISALIYQIRKAITRIAKKSKGSGGS